LGLGMWTKRQETRDDLPSQTNLQAFHFIALLSQMVHLDKVSNQEEKSSKKEDKKR
jgi:hypothetical protein